MRYDHGKESPGKVRIKKAGFKAIMLGSILISGMLLLTSCGSQQASGNTAQTGPNGTYGANGAFNRNAPDLYGEVKTVTGNTVTLALIEIPQRQFSGNGGGFQGNGGGQGNGSGQGNGGRNRRNNNGGSQGNGTGGGNGDQNGNGGNGGQNGNGGSNGGSNGGQGGSGAGQGRQGMTRNYTGQTQTVTIPDGVSITTFQRGNNGMEQKQIKVSDIKTGMLLQIWYKKDSGDAKTIDSIRVMPDFQGGFGGPGFNRQGQTGQQGQQGQSGQQVSQSG